jgi:DNA-binding LacI/PurR family transcriptional regulator
VAMVGFDDIPAARSAVPSLTTIRQNTESAGELLVDALVRLIEDEPAESTRLSTTLVVRQSTNVSSIARA